ncbi:hypothetical protein GH5_07454 [Leishmania sp. Ghana 2012 LV757]|uniref:hypothetical protein n=1 Tax=Leishmania sp. Ghana 2012 LV757 TaxID=2803181 RepID=UPI001B7C7CAA|nr:hypothetical protein GH5_07454 [Leishmania sp. Ghana 2012 LV757]
MQPSALPAESSLGPPQPADRRQIVPLMGSSTSGGGGGAAAAQLSVGSPEAAPRQTSYTANLEAQVRVLEQEVHLLRTGLEQNERLRGISAAAAPLQQRSSSSSKRVHFAPSPVIAQSPPPLSARASSASVTGVDGRPRLVFGQRVDSTNSRISAHGPPNAAPSQARRAASLSKSSRSSARSGSVPSPSTTPGTTNTTFVQLSPAPSSLRGGNTSGVPLQGAATGGTLVSPTVANVQPPASLPAGSPSTSAAAATVWASADPRRLWPRVATAALSHYPFRTTTASSLAALSTPGIPNPPATSSAQPVSAPVGTSSAAASPIVVAMSSDGPPLTSLTQPGTPTAGPVIEATLSPTAAPAAPSAPSAPAAGTALAVTHSILCATTPPSHMAATTPAEASAPPVAGSSASVAATATEPETEVLVLRDTLAQREALLHRVLLELHDRHGSGGAHRQSSPAMTTSEVKERQQSRQAMRLLAEELFAAQTQLSHARISHQLVLAELHTCRQQVHRAPSPKQQQAAALERTSPAEASQPSPGPLQEQLDVALRKLKAWEDWYATSATAGGDEAAGVTAGNINALSAAKGSSSRPEQSPKPKGPNAEYQVGAAAVRGSHTKKSGHKREKHMYETSTLSRCPHCGFGLPGLAPACAIAGFPGYHPSLSSPSALAPQRLPAAAPPVPYVSAYALDSILLQHLASRCDGSAEVGPEVAVTTSGGAATPPPPPPEDASSSSSPAQIAEVRHTSGDMNVLKKVSAGTGHESRRTGACDATSMWGVPMGTSTSIAGAGGGATSSLYVSPYCDKLDHAQQQAYRAQRYVEQLAHGAAVRELAEAERQVAEQRLSLWEHHRPYAKSLSATSPTSPSRVPFSSTPDGGPRSTEAGKQEVVE